MKSAKYKNDSVVYLFAEVLKNDALELVWRCEAILLVREGMILPLKQSVSHGIFFDLLYQCCCSILPSQTSAPKQFPLSVVPFCFAFYVVSLLLASLTCGSLFPSCFFSCCCCLPALSHILPYVTETVPLC